MWEPEPTIRPRAWIENFEESDKLLAAKLLERFVFYNQRLTDSLLINSFYSIADGLRKGPAAPPRDTLLHALPDAVFTPVAGETPNPTDSGYLLCRRARQVLKITESQIMTTSEALDAAKKGHLIVFVDDFIGSGDQFLTTWRDSFFSEAQKTYNFPAIYICLVGTSAGIDRINQEAPTVAVCVTHKIDNRETFWGIENYDKPLYNQLDALLKKYAPRLTPHESYMSRLDYKIYGYKRRGLFFAFEHSVPDATLPIFWCRGTNNWEPLIERT